MELERSVPRTQTADPPWVRRLVIGIGVTFLALFVLVPLATVLVAALSNGVGAYFDAINDPAAMRALQLTLIAAVISVPLNLVFGIAAAWAIARFRFPGRSLLIMSRLEAYDYRGATALALVMLVVSFALLLAINFLGAWSRRRAGHL